MSRKIEKKEFTNKQLTFTSEEFPTLRVTRTRTTDGYASITLRVQTVTPIPGSTDRGEHTLITFVAEDGADYELKVRVLARLLIEAADEPCLIESAPKKISGASEIIDSEGGHLLRNS